MWVSNLRKTSPCLIGFVSVLQSQALRSFLYFFVHFGFNPVTFFFVLSSWPFPPKVLLQLSPPLPLPSYSVPISALQQLLCPVFHTQALQYLYQGWAGCYSSPYSPVTAWQKSASTPGTAYHQGRNSDIPFCRKPPSCQIPEMFGFRSLAYFKAWRIYLGDTLKSC